MTEPDSPPAVSASAAQFSADEDRMWAAIAHLGGIVGILPSLVIYLAMRHRGKVIATESKEALNWQITFLAGWVIIDVIVLVVLGVVVTAALGPGGHAGGVIVLVAELIPAALWVLNIVLSVLGFLRVNGGGSYRYPFSVRLLK